MTMGRLSHGMGLKISLFHTTILPLSHQKKAENKCT